MAALAPEMTGGPGLARFRMAWKHTKTKGQKTPGLGKGIGAGGRNRSFPRTFKSGGGGDAFIRHSIFFSTFVRTVLPRGGTRFLCADRSVWDLGPNLNRRSRCLMFGGPGGGGREEFKGFFFVFISVSSRGRIATLLPGRRGEMSGPTLSPRVAFFLEKSVGGAPTLLESLNNKPARPRPVFFFLPGLLQGPEVASGAGRVV